MKNIFKLMGIALIAGSMMVACGEKNDVEMYTITANANDATMGTVTGGGEYEVNSSITLEAVANAGYVFVNWEDGTTNNPRIVTVTGDATYTANFAPEQGVKVTFGTNTWEAGYINGQVVSGSALLLACGQTTSTAYPQFILQYAADGALAAGTFQGSSTVTNSVSFDGPQIWYFESDDNDFIQLTYQDGSSVIAGDWWDKTMTLNISEFDATALTISCIANATMGHVHDVLEGSTWDAATSRDLTIKVSNQTLTSAKCNLLPTAGMIARR